MEHNKRRLLSGLLYSGVPTMALSVLCLTGCQEEFGGYYNQPGWVAASSEQVLKSHGDCSTYLQLVSKTLFSKQVEGSGQYTFLVPTDQAFADFFANNPYGYTSVDDIPEDVAARMVSSWMMYNSYPCDTLANVLTGFNTWDVNQAFKHKTPSYDVLREETIDGEVYQMYDYPYTSSSFGISDNSLTWHNYRYLPIWTSRYVSNNSISMDDWRKVVGSEFSQYGNYVSAGIIDSGSGATNPGDLYCQNGVIHLVNKVVMPLENMDALIRTYGDGSAVDEPAAAKQGGWKLLRNLLNFKKGNGEYAFYILQENTAAKHYFEKMYPDLDLTNFRLRSYYGGKNPFLLNVEDYETMALGGSSSDDLFYTNYNGGMTFFVPEKDVLLNYINNRLFKYIGVELSASSTQEEFDAAFNKMSINVPVSLWKAMQSDGMIWPSQFESSAVNSVGSSEHITGYDASISFDNNALSSGIASNGMWHIINYVPKTAAFEGIASRFLLDPAYSIEEDIITDYSFYSNMLKSKLAGMDDVNLSLILWGDANAQWWDNIHYSTLLSTYAHGDVGNESSVQSQLLNNIYNSYVERESVDALDLEVDPLDGAYGGWAYTNNYSGQVMRYRKSGKTIDGKPEIQIQTAWSIRNDANERAWWDDASLMPEKLQQSEPTEGSYASVVKDKTVDFVNGNVYTATEHSAPLTYYLDGNYGDGTHFYNSSHSALSYLKSYLAADAASSNPQHTIFKKFWDYYESFKTNSSKKGTADTISIGSGNWTIFVPTDEALQAAIDYGKDHDISLMVDPSKLPSDPTANDANWLDSVIYILTPYITKSGCYPDDGLSAIYETSEAWDGISASNREAPKQYLVTTNAKITDVDHIVGDKVIKPWDGLISGAQMSGYVAKTGDGNKLQYFGRPYTSGAYEVVNVYNSNEMTNTFDNTVVREAGQSNIIAPSCMIHSLNGFVIYKIASH